MRIFGWMVIVFAFGSLSDVSEAARKPKRGELTKAVRQMDLNLVRSLIDKGADINEDMGTGGEHMTPVMIAAAFGQRDITLFLVNRGASLHYEFHNYTARDFAAYTFSGESEVVRMMDSKLSKQQLN